MRRCAISEVLLPVLLAAMGIALTGCGRVHGKPAERAAGAKGHVFFRVVAPSSAEGALHGRLLIFVKQGSGDRAIDMSEQHVEDTWIAAREIAEWTPGDSVEVDANERAFPRAFSEMPAGSYEAQAVLDVDHSYNYKGRNPRDWISEVTPLGDWTPGSGTEPVLRLSAHPEPDWKREAAILAAGVKARFDGGHEEELVSPSLTRFWGHEVAIKAWVFLPPGYSQGSNQTYPTVYWTHAFGGGLDSALANGLRIRDRMSDGKLPPMIWVMLDESIPQGTHEFADSANDGPWGEALTAEFIPYLEAKYRMDARPTGRLLQGHSSGGWATLQLQINYPEIFGGTWSTSPDASDFHDFNGVDLYAPGANLYRRPDGSRVPIVRKNGKVVITMEELARLEEIVGPRGGQLESFEWVFSPKGPNGAPEPMFDRQTGKVDSRVAAYWRDHYDLAWLAEANWKEHGRDLKGRIHVAVGTEDTFYLDGSAHQLEAVLTKLGGDPHFHYLAGRTHFDVYTVGDDPGGLIDQMGAEMYAVARPGVEWKVK